MFLIRICVGYATFSSLAGCCMLMSETIKGFRDEFIDGAVIVVSSSYQSPR